MAKQKSPMLGISLKIAGGLFVLIGCLLLLLARLGQVSNASERNYIRDHHTYSIPGAFTWSDWQPNDGSVTHFEFPTAGHEQRQKLPITEFRRGLAHGFLFDFIAFEGRSAGDQVSAAFPVLGPDWGAHYNSIWAITAFAIGIIVIVVSRYFTPCGNGDFMP